MSASVEIRTYRGGPMDNNTYLVIDTATGDTALIDPSFDTRPIWAEIQQANLKLRYLLNTHAHFDHIVENAYFASQSGAPLGLHRDDLALLTLGPKQAEMFGAHIVPSPQPQIFLHDNQILTLGETQLTVIHTPGHAPGHVTFLVGEWSIAGDCLFAGSIGRTDLPGASSETLLHSIRTRLLTLPESTIVLPGHGDATSIGEEMRSNPFLQGDR